jgi:molybdopterin converting factor small subunit
MATVYLPSSLRELAGGTDRIDVEGNDVGSLVAELESRYPPLTGRVREERGVLRPHVKIFVNGEVVGLEDAVKESDEVRILPSISGGSGEAELLVGTRKGLFVLRGLRGGEMQVAGKTFEGLPVEYAIRDPRTGSYLASVTDWHFGPRVFRSDDPLKGWEPSDGPLFPDDVDASVERIWTIEPGVEDGVLWAGVAPAALFKSEDGGATWSLNRALWDVPERAKWQPGAGGLCLHSICPWPGEAARMAIGISAAGVWLTEDGGESWTKGNEGLVPGYVPEDAQEDEVGLCVHDIKRSPVADETLYMQFHGGVYRSDDAGSTWQNIGTDNGLPSDFGFPMVIDPTDDKRALVIPLIGGENRVTPDGKMNVYETRDGGATWQPRGKGLPQNDAYLTILRQAFCNDDQGGESMGLYFGCTSGDVFGSADGGATWSTVARYLPPVLAVRAS